MSELFIKRKFIESDSGDPALIFTVDLDIKQTDTFERVYKAFIDYKTRSANDEMPAPSEDDQLDYEPVNPLFGKDRPNHFPKPKVKEENIHHVHVFDGSRSWKTWNLKEQFKRSCDTLLFYSYFERDSSRYFHLLDFLYNPTDVDKSHVKMKDDLYMQTLADKAEAYRLYDQSPFQPE